ncbi:nucleotide exchange factor GrpE [Peribacillus frigoritolerans]|uniref:nucleotide exchange factor GrpE n=1 Tax=Peribacillus frigoritolerans TaxID=450367 RepID=UPI00105A2479|nr:nucleotide exchange factor GrpE [Peribacillus frigoritolerans]TDL82241.1 nucleotide exchange factor GrpE [Peribacillus frigoritolerans]
MTNDAKESLKENETATKQEETLINQEGESADSDIQAEQAQESDELTAAKAKIDELEAKLSETENRMYRVQADLDNFRRRARLDLEAAQKYRSQNLITEILPALDNFERALKIDTDDEKTQSLLQGMDMVYRQLVQALQNEGIEAIQAEGQPFDPHLHQAVMQVEDDQYESNVVIEEFQKGYKLKDRIIRPAMVKVNQ